MLGRGPSGAIVMYRVTMMFALRDRVPVRASPKRHREADGGEDGRFANVQQNDRSRRESEPKFDGHAASCGNSVRVQRRAPVRRMHPGEPSGGRIRCAATPELPIQPSHSLREFMGSIRIQFGLAGQFRFERAVPRVRQRHSESALSAAIALIGTHGLFEPPSDRDQIAFTFSTRRHGSTHGVLRRFETCPRFCRPSTHAIREARVVMAFPALLERLLQGGRCCNSDVDRHRGGHDRETHGRGSTTPSCILWPWCHVTHRCFLQRRARMHGRRMPCPARRRGPSRPRAS